MSSNAGNAFLDTIGDKILGQTAESENNNAQVMPDASITPVTQGRRSRRPEGNDPFHSDAPTNEQA